MLTGVRGVGKTTTARILARALNYKTTEKDAPDITLAEMGEHCEEIMAGRHVDVLEMDAASHTGIDDIRDIIASTQYRPISAAIKFILSMKYTCCRKTPSMVYLKPWKSRRPM